MGSRLIWDAALDAELVRRRVELSQSWERISEDMCICQEALVRRLRMIAPHADGKIAKRANEWTDDELARLRELLADPKYTHDSIARVLGRSSEAISHRARRLARQERAVRFAAKNSLLQFA